MITNLSRLIGYRLALYFADNGMDMIISGDDLMSTGDEADVYAKVLAWKGPKDPLLKNLDDGFRKSLPSSSLTGAWRADIIVCFYHFKDILYVHRHLRECPLSFYDMAIPKHLYECACTGAFVLSEARYTAIRLAMECTDWIDAMYIFYRVVKMQGDSLDTRGLRAYWIADIPMDEYLNGFSDENLEKFEKLKENNQSQAALSASETPSSDGSIKQKFKIVLKRKEKREGGI